MSTDNPFKREESAFHRTRSAKLSIDFAVRMGLQPDPDLAEELQSALATQGQKTWNELQQAGHPLTPLPLMQFPRSLLEMLVATLTWESSENGPDNGIEQAEAIRRHYVEWMPALLVENACRLDGPAAPFFHTPIQLKRMPRMRRALKAAFALLQACDVDPRLCFGASSMGELVEGKTLFEVYQNTHFGGCMPMLYTYPRDIAAYNDEIAAGEDVLDVFDRRLTAPFLHELMHLQRHRRGLYPPLLEECVAGYLGVHIYPEFAYPQPGEDNGIYASPLFGQIGQAMVRAGGLQKVVMAHAAMIGWHKVIGRGVIQTAERLGWELYTNRRDIHFLTGNRNPRPWINFFFLGPAAAECEFLSDVTDIEFDELEGDEVITTMDVRILADAFRAACASGGLDERTRTYRVSTVLPVRTHVDWERGICTRLDAGDDGTQSEVVYELIPPSIARAWRARGVSGHTVQLNRPHDPMETARSLAAIETPVNATPTTEPG